MASTLWGKPASSLSLPNLVTPQVLNFGKHLLSTRGMPCTRWGQLSNLSVDPCSQIPRGLIGKLFIKEESPKQLVLIIAAVHPLSCHNCEIVLFQ